MTDQRRRLLDSGLSFKARPCAGMYPSQQLIDAAKGHTEGRAESNDNGDSGTKVSTVSVTHLGAQFAGIGDFLRA